MAAATEAREAAAALRRISAELATHSLGTYWRSPAKDACEAELVALERSAHNIARRLEIWADQEGAASARAESL
jgi:hypothetical protein